MITLSTNCSDIIGDNGVVHVIDAVLIPSGVSPSSPNVSTVPENKNVILEEFTGIQCYYCPDGHLIADQIQSNNINDVYVIKIHTGFILTHQQVNLILEHNGGQWL